jgi:hypothetical protein
MMTDVTEQFKMFMGYLLYAVATVMSVVFIVYLMDLDLRGDWEGWLAVVTNALFYFSGRIIGDVRKVG